MKTIKDTVEASSYQVQEMVNTILNGRTNELDNYMLSVKDALMNVDILSNDDLYKISLRLPTYHYYLISVLQDIELQKGVATEQSKYYENDALIGTTGTVSERTAKASNATIKNRVVALAYKIAVGTVQLKMNAVLELIKTIKFVQQGRLEERRLTKLAGDAIGG